MGETEPIKEGWGLKAGPVLRRRKAKTGTRRGEKGTSHPEAAPPEEQIGWKSEGFGAPHAHVPVLVLLHHLEPLERLQHAPGHAAGAAAEVAGPHAAPLPPPVHLGHGAHPRAPPQVEVPGGGGCEGIKKKKPTKLGM